jgi:hypothetical protein
MAYLMTLSVTLTQRRMLSRTVNNEMEIKRKKWSWPNIYYPRNSLEGMKKTTKDLNQDSRSTGRDLNPELPEHEAEMLHSWPRYSVH